MKKLITISILSISLTGSLKSQVKAITENGREVSLFPDGTWKYAAVNSDSLEENKNIPVNPKEFSKSPSASFLLKSNIFNIGVYLNPVKWTFIPHPATEVNPEYKFEMKGSKGYGMIITERTPILIESLREIVLENAQKVATDVKIIHSEFRNVNGVQVLCLTMSGTSRGIKFVYLGYYFSNDNGTMQLLTYGSENMYAQYKEEWENFLNGFTVIKD